MKPINTVKVLFCLAVLLFIAKPFIGYNILAAVNHIEQPQSILVKIFSQRKPEDLDEAKTFAAGIHQNLTNPPLLITIMALLGLLFPALYKRVSDIKSSFITDHNLALVPVHRPYFLSGKLTI